MPVGSRTSFGRLLALVFAWTAQGRKFGLCYTFASLIFPTAPPLPRSNMCFTPAANTEWLPWSLWIRKMENQVPVWLPRTGWSRDLDLVSTPEATRVTGIVNQLWAWPGAGEVFSVLCWQLESSITECRYCNVLVMGLFFMFSILGGYLRGYKSEVLFGIWLCHRQGWGLSFGMRMRPSLYTQPAFKLHRCLLPE